MCKKWVDILNTSIASCCTSAYVVGNSIEMQTTSRKNNKYVQNRVQNKNLLLLLLHINELKC